jgi:uncharacterized protein YceH (UPF0502 family)
VNPELSAVETRVLGALIEKDMATPEYYPLTLNALVNACNQKSNRDPVVNYDQDIIDRAIESLREKRLATVITGGDNRVPKHAHRASETLDLGNRELAVLCVLMLRGPQTAAEIKSRTERLHRFDDTDSVESCLRRLSERESGPLTVLLPRQPGMREARWAHLLCGAPEAAPSFEEPAATHRADRLAELEARVASLEGELAALRAEMAGFRR